MRKPFRSAVFGAVLAGGLAVGVGVAVASGSGPSPAAPGGAAVTHWPVNAHGLTFGSGRDAVSPNDEPDLIKAIATNGKVGYVLRTDLEESPATPQQALALQAAHAGRDQVIPVFLSDGVTKIGVFVITHHGAQAGHP